MDGEIEDMRQLPGKAHRLFFIRSVAGEGNGDDPQSSVEYAEFCAVGVDMQTGSILAEEKCIDCAAAAF